MSKIFKLLEKNPNDHLTVEEFVESYVYYEEKLRIKLIKIEKFLDDLTEDKKIFEERKIQAQTSEVKKENGLTNKSNIFITIIEAKDLEYGKFMGSSNPFVQITFQGNSQKSLVNKDTCNPAWNENFKFEVNSPEGIIKIEILNETFLGNKSYGYINFDLNDLKDQEERISWFDLSSGKGKIRMKILCIFSLVSFFENQLNKTISELNNFEMVYDDLAIYDAQMKIPFGIIYSQYLDPLLNKENLNNIEKVIEFKRDSKKNIYASGKNDNKNKNNSISFCECW